MFKSIIRFWNKRRDTLMYVGMLVAIFAALALFMRNDPSHVNTAPVKSVVMPRRDAEVTILANGDAQVVETWQTIFIGGPFHTAFRTIPLNRLSDVLDFNLSEGETNYVPAIPGRAEPPNTFSESTGNNGKTFQWYFPETTTASRTFTLRYTMQGVVRIYPGGDQFYWKFIEAGRAYPIDAAHVIVHLPGNFSADQLKLGTFLSAGQAKPIDASTVAFDGGPFPANSEWEVRTQFPHGAVTASAPSWQATADAEDTRIAQIQTINLFQIWGGIIVLIGGLLGVAVWHYARRPQPTSRLGVNYVTEPPEALAPGLAGTLLDGGPDPKDVVATLVDLARRGFLIMQAQGDDYGFDRVRGKDENTLRPYELELLRNVFGDAQHCQLSALRDEFADVEQRIEYALSDELIRAGYFVNAATQTRPLVISILSKLVGLTTFFVLAPFYFVSGAFWFLSTFGGATPPTIPTQIALVVFDLTAIMIVFYAIVWIEGRKSIRSVQGTEATAKWQAFKRYLQNIRRYTDVAQAKQLFEKYLSYAIAFGVEENWLGAFRSVGTPAPSWYTTGSDEDRSFQRQHQHNAPFSIFSGASRSSSDRSAPSLDDLASGAFRGLDSMSASFIGMLNSAADVMTSERSSFGGGGGGSGSNDGSSSSSSGSSDSWSGGSSGGGGGSGGGSSGFG